MGKRSSGDLQGIVGDEIGRVGDDGRDGGLALGGGVAAVGGRSGYLRDRDADDRREGGVLARRVDHAVASDDVPGIRSGVVLALLVGRRERIGERSAELRKVSGLDRRPGDRVDGPEHGVRAGEVAAGVELMQALEASAEDEPLGGRDIGKAVGVERRKGARLRRGDEGQGVGNGSGDRCLRRAGTGDDAEGDEREQEQPRAKRQIAFGNDN